MQTKVKELMTPNPATISPESSLMDAAKQMNEMNYGVLPVGERNRLEGIITDRDIVIRAVARGRDVSQEKVKDYMTAVLFYCNEDDTAETAADLMREHRVTRLLVRDSKGNTTGILTFGRILRQDDAENLSDVVQHATGKKAA